MNAARAPVSATWVGDPEAIYRHGLPVAAREPRLRAVLLETLATPGSLTRLRLALLAAEVLGVPPVVARDLATALEYFHTASLLLDDLPCMDDAHERRGRSCVHRRHGEAAAILGALAFINRAYALLWGALDASPPDCRQAAAAHAERCLGVAGVLDGQSLDLHLAPAAATIPMVARTALGKTVALLRLTLVTPAWLAGAAPRERLLLNRLSVYWGLAYQIADDCADVTRDDPAPPAQPGGGAARGRPNFVVTAGTERTAEQLDRLLALVRRTWAQLVALRPGWHALAPMIIRLNHAAVVGLASLETVGRLPPGAVRRCA